MSNWPEIPSVHLKRLRQMPNACLLRQLGSLVDPCQPFKQPFSCQSTACLNVPVVVAYTVQRQRAGHLLTLHGVPKILSREMNICRQTSVLEV